MCLATLMQKSAHQSARPAQARTCVLQDEMLIMGGALAFICTLTHDCVSSVMWGKQKEQLAPVCYQVQPLQSILSPR